MKLVEVTDVKTKKLFFKKFTKSYKNMRPADSATFGPLRKYLAAYVDGKYVGFIVLTNKSGFFQDLEVWCAAEAYVEPKFRSRGCLREMLKLVIRDHHVRLVHIEAKRMWANAEYYVSLGFALTFGSSELVFARLTRDIELLERHQVDAREVHSCSAGGAQR